MSKLSRKSRSVSTQTDNESSIPMQQSGTVKLNPQLTRHINQTPRKSRLSAFIRQSVKNGNLNRSNGQSLNHQSNAPPTPRPLSPRRSYAKQKAIRDPACSTSLVEMIGAHKHQPTRQFSEVNQSTPTDSEHEWTKSQRDIRSQLKLAAASPLIQSPIYLAADNSETNSTSSANSSTNSPKNSEKIANPVTRKLNLVLDVNGRELPLKLDLNFDSVSPSNLRVKRILLDNRSILSLDQYGHFIADQSL
ncbi:hypothetical protein M3Y96_01013400 [Aphelenchoides besseyi]|nr:hypothetical protein M3Y96_01013400 [Aphelenchoides besseyi]